MSTTCRLASLALGLAAILGCAGDAGDCDCGAEAQTLGVLIDRLIRWLIIGEEEDTSIPQIMISQSRVPLGKTIEVTVQYARVIHEASATVRLSVTTPNQQIAPLPLDKKPGGYFTAKFTASDPGEFIFLAADPERLAALKAKVEANRLSEPLFDTERLTRHLERGYRMMWENHEAGRPPCTIEVPALPAGDEDRAGGGAASRQS